MSSAQHQTSRAESIGSQCLEPSHRVSNDSNCTTRFVGQLQNLGTVKPDSAPRLGCAFCDLQPLCVSTCCAARLQVPPNGLVVYTGTVVTEEGKEKKVNIDFEPFKPINTSLYLCDNKFHTEALNELLESDSTWVSLAFAILHVCLLPIC